MNWANVYLENFKKAEESLKKLGNDMTSWSKTIDINKEKHFFLGRDTEDRIKIAPSQHDIDYSEKLLELRKKKLTRRVEKFKSRLQVFVDIGVWKVRKEVKITDEDPKLQKLLIYFTHESLDIEVLAKEIDVKRFKSTNMYSELRSILTQAQEKIQSELKLREAKSKKRKMLFLLE
jgi:hypothetical protein